MKVVRQSLATQIKPQTGGEEVRRCGVGGKLVKVEKRKYNVVDAYVHCSEFLFYYFVFFFLFFLFIYICIFLVLYGAFHLALRVLENFSQTDTCKILVLVTLAALKCKLNAAN